MRCCHLGGVEKVEVDVMNFLQNKLFTVAGTQLTMYDIVIFLSIFLGMLACSLLIKKNIQRIAKDRSIEDQANIHIVGKLAYYAVIIGGIFISLSSLGLDFTKLAILISALSVGIGFGLQAIFNNFVSGVILLFDRSIKVGDIVELTDGLLGTVKEISIRSTLLNTPDNLDVVIPNSEFVNSRVNNWTLTDRYRRIKVPFGVHYKSDKELVKSAVLEAANRRETTIKHIAGKEPDVWLVNFGDSSLNFELIVWVDPSASFRPVALKAAYLWEIHTSLLEHEIEIPYPQRDVHIIAED